MSSTCPPPVRDRFPLFWPPRATRLLFWRRRAAPPTHAPTLSSRVTGSYFFGRRPEPPASWQFWHCPPQRSAGTALRAESVRDRFLEFFVSKYYHHRWGAHWLSRPAKRAAAPQRPLPPAVAAPCAPPPPSAPPQPGSTPVTVVGSTVQYIVLCSTVQYTG